MGSLEGRVAIITGAGRGLGREHALLFASEGAKVVVNDLGEVAEEVAAEIRAQGGEAVASNHDITDWDGGRELVEAAVGGFGRLDVLVNNAGILRDRMLVSMSEEEWDLVVDVHMKGHFVPTRFAAAYWREQVKAGATVQGSIIHTSSTSGLLGNPGQTNYGAAKAGIGSFSIICAQELARYGVLSSASDLEFAQYLAREKGVAVVPVSAFYHDGFDEGLVRFCFAKENATLQAATARLR